jgi:hypothetical protein
VTNRPTSSTRSVRFMLRRYVNTLSQKFLVLFNGHNWNYNGPGIASLFVMVIVSTVYTFNSGRVQKVIPLVL